MPTFICAQGFAEPLRCRRSLHALLMPNFFASSGIAQRSQVRIFARCEHHDASRAHAWQKDELLVYYYSNHPETALACSAEKPELGSDKTEGWHGKRPDQVARRPGPSLQGTASYPSVRVHRSFSPRHPGSNHPSDF